MNLNILITLLGEQLDRDGTWVLDTHDLPGILEMDQLDLFRILHTSRHPLVSGGIDTISLKEGGVLIALLEELGYSSAEEEFKEGGIYLTMDQRIDLQEYWLEEFSRQRDLHIPHLQDFEDMLAHFKSVRRSLDVYREQYFDPWKAAVTAIDFYLETVRCSSPNRLRMLCTAWLKEFLSRPVFIFDQILEPVWEVLVAAAKAAGYVPEWESIHRAGQDYSEAYSGQEDFSRSENTQQADSGRFKAALTLFCLPEREFSREALKNRYKQLMKKWHPDINPNGLEMCQKLNNGYAYLVSVLNRR